jgi:4-aminobutyrate aminotransferase-like enzyme/Ser/Thr protein kinase RdoA (MazF antagonist)
MSTFDEQQMVCPQFPEGEVRAILREQYGIAAAALKPLGSFQDQNFAVTASDGQQFVLKIANSATPPAELALQNRVLAHLAARDPSFPTPRLIPALDGAAMPTVARDGENYPVRLLSYLPGEMLARVGGLPAPALLETIGAFAGRLAALLSDCPPPDAPSASQWDLRHAGAVVRAYRGYVANPAHRELLDYFLDLHERLAAPLLAHLPTAVIHDDITTYNLLVDPATDPPAISGLIDFGDVMHSYAVGELVVAVSETALTGARDPLHEAAPLIAAFDRARPLSDDELAVLFPLVALRRCVVAASAAQQLAFEPDNAYVQELSTQDWPVLERLRATPPELALAAWRAACGRAPHPGAERVRAWLATNAAQIHPILDPALLVGAPTLDLSAASPDLRDGAWESPAALRAAVESQLRNGAGLGRYAEARLQHGAPNTPDEPATLHLGADAFVPAGTPAHAPLAGTVVRAADGEVLLQHAPADGVSFFTRLAGLELAEGLEKNVVGGQPLGVVAAPGANGATPPHLHLQLGVELIAGTLPGLGRASLRDAWLALCPDPSPLLGVQAAAPASPPADALLQRRGQVVQQSQEYYYQRPMTLVRGWRQYLYDDAGRAYLDAINNVAHVGHSHPHVGAAITRQLALLNTNSRFLYRGIVEYAERVAALLPDPLRVVFFVCSGSEANDLALRLARAHTRQHDVVVIDGEYHGNTTAVDEISTSLLDNPQAKNTRPWVHAAMRPNPFLGPFPANDPDCGAKYAADVARAVGEVREQGRGVAAFFTESLLGSSGGVALPAGYLHHAYAAVRAAGGLCIADEVQVGFGRMGTHFWAFETQGVVPDIVTMGKPIGNGYPLAAVVTTPAIAESFRQTTTYFNTYGGNPVACAAGMAVLDIIEGEGLQAQALEVGRAFRAALAGLGAHHEQLGAVYGQGMYLGAELVRDRAGKAPATALAMRVAERMRELGVIVYPTGDHYNVLKIKPPLVFNHADVDFFMAMLDRALRECV